MASAKIKDLTLSRYSAVLEQLELTPATWLITGVTGFIGSNLLEHLLKLNQKVIGLDNFSTGSQENLDAVREIVGNEKWARFTFIQGDIRDLEVCQTAAKNVDYILHQAALGSVPRSLKDPITTNDVNIGGFLNMLVAARDCKSLKQFVYAASSSTYGDSPLLPKTENVIGKPLSPYAVTKYVNELYADIFAQSYGFRGIGLRYFNVFGPRQDPHGAYAAVIPLWVKSFFIGENVVINGDGETSRDFCFIENVVQANILAATVTAEEATNQVYNVAFGEQTSLNQLSKMIAGYVGTNASDVIHQEFRNGDVRHSLADISKARQLLGYEPQYSVQQGLEITVNWHRPLYVTR